MHLARRVHSWWRRTRATLGPVFGVRAPSAPPPRAARTASAPAKSLVRTTAKLAPTLPPPDHDSVRRDLERRLQRQCSFLKDVYGARADAADALDLLRDVEEHGERQIRQPPRAAQAVLALLRRRNYSIAQITRLIEQDPALAQQLLRHANSAWYATPGAQPVAAITPAVQRIGTSGVHAAVIASTITEGLLRPGGRFDQMARMVWEHMVRTAPIAREVASWFGVDPDQAYTLGLTHDAGKLVLFDRMAQLRRRRRRALRFPKGFVRGALALLHEPLGGLAALSWGLDGAFARGVAGHHRTDPDTDGDTLAQVAFLAERIDLARVSGTPLNPDGWWEEGRLQGEPRPIAASLSMEGEP